MTRIIIMVSLAAVFAGLIILYRVVAANRSQRKSGVSPADDSGQAVSRLRRCEHCGHLNALDGSFCGKCGDRIE